MRTGTSHFYTVTDAVAYYAEQGIDRKEVHRKFDDGEISLDSPNFDSKTQYIQLIEGRWWIMDKCPMFNPIISEVFGPTKHCRDCGRTAKEHE